MDIMTKALQRARQDASFREFAGAFAGRQPERLTAARVAARRPSLSLPGDVVSPAEAHLRQNRVVAFDETVTATRHYDILRNQVPHHHSKDRPQIIAVSSPTTGCGVSVTAANLAFSFARARSQRVALLDATGGGYGLRKLLGLTDGCLAPDPTEPQADPCTSVQVKGSTIYLIEQAEDGAGRKTIAEIVRDVDATVAIVDLPPLLSSNRDLSVLNLADCVFIVLAVGHTTVADAHACKTSVSHCGNVQFVLNKCGKHGL